jgi:TRAP-type C4-dicarboxylate transport system permease small subunit
MHAMNVLPLQLLGVATVLTVALALWAGSGATGAPALVRRTLLAVDRYTSGAAAILACVAMVVAVSAGAWQVVARFATETPSVWSEALVRTAVVWVAFIGVAVALRAGALVSIDVARRLTRGAVRRALEAASLAAILSTMGVMFWFGWLMAERVKFQEMAGLEVSMSWGYAAIPVGACFAMIGAVAHFLDQRPTDELETAL